MARNTKRGRPPLKDKALSVRFSLRLTPVLEARLLAAAERSGRDLHEFCREVLATVAEQVLTEPAPA